MGSMWRCWQKKIHTTASIRHNQNFIATIQDDTRQLISDHEAKAKVLFEAYRNRLDTSQSPEMVFDLHAIFPNTQDLSILEEPFLEEEINSVIANLPNCKALGSDFLKKCWSVISQDFYDLCKSFHDKNVCM